MCITRFDLVRHILSVALKNAVHITMKLPASRVPVGVVSICRSKFIFSYLYWSARRQGLWSWQSGLSDLGVDQQPIWAQGPGWIYISGCGSMLGFPIRSFILEASGEWDAVFFVAVVFVITKIMRLAITSINAWFSGYLNEFSVESLFLFVCLFYSCVTIPLCFHANSNKAWLQKPVNNYCGLRKVSKGSRCLSGCIKRLGALGEFKSGWNVGFKASKFICNPNKWKLEY